MTTHTITLPVTVARSTREVEFGYSERADQTTTIAFSTPVFTSRIGRGTKTHKCSAMAWRFDSVEAAKRKGYSTDRIVEQEDGSAWGIQLTSVVLNRQAYITGWVEDAPATSKHIMEYPH